MGVVMRETKGRADGAALQRLLRERLEGAERGGPVVGRKLVPHRPPRSSGSSRRAR